MAKHSLAPWEIGEEYCNVRDEIVDAEGCTIAVVWTRRPSNPYATARMQFVDSATLKANARLIAAAPDLLESLQALLVQVEADQQATPGALAGHPQGRELHQRMIQAKQAARNAIQKATQE